MPKTWSDKRTAARTPNKIQWGLSDIVLECNRALKHWGAIQDYAEQKHDALLATKAGRLRDSLARIRSKAKDALNGEYEPD